MRRHWLVGAAMVATTLFAPSAIGAPSSGPQAAYDAAQAAYDKRDWATAIAGFTPLLPSDPSHRLSRSQAVIASRLGDALVHADRREEATAWLDRVIADVPADDADTRDHAWLWRGDAARSGFDYPAAVAAYDHVFDDPQMAQDVLTLLNAGVGLAYVDVTRDPAHVAAVLDKLLARLDLPTTVGTDILAEVEDLRARAAINLGDRNAAQHWIERALNHSGGLTTGHVSVGQATIRDDAAIIARLRNDDEDTRKYLTYTGAGHMKSMDWIGHVDGDLPVCGGEVAPQDSVVVQFYLGDDGKVAGALPVYASKAGDDGQIFAETVSHWRWNPADLRDVDPYYRFTLRLELRCATRPPPDQLGKPYEAALQSWLSSLGLPDGKLRYNEPFAPTRDSRESPGLHQADGAGIAALFKIVPASPEGRLHFSQMLDTIHAPPPALAALIMRIAKANGYRGHSIRSDGRLRSEALAAMQPAFRARFPDSAANAWLILEQALADEDSGDFANAPALLQAVIDTPAATLADDDPVRQVAILHLALSKARAGDPGAAHARLAAANLDAERCTLFDTHPVPASVDIASSQFPMDALRWRFEGYVQESYDILANGHVANIRTVLAYPPFVFSQDTERAVASFRYLPPSIGDAPVGCQGETKAVRYHIPG
jgi:tetratricopeptide (TPR) repeat protein